MSVGQHETALDPSLDGARILWRMWRSPHAREGYVREFSVGAERVRLAETILRSDVGVWLAVRDVRVVAVLDPAKAPKPDEPAPKGRESRRPPLGDCDGQTEFPG